MLSDETKPYTVRCRIASQMPQRKLNGPYTADERNLIVRDRKSQNASCRRSFIVSITGERRRGVDAEESVPRCLWTLLRRRTTTAFTSGKLEATFPTIVKRTLLAEQPPHDRFKFFPHTH
ncbi:hypothetical protein EVAR_37593_1 [Eumeta japonica]|uniref:Uncharacterized protein n=1 Tax=Eumeta variegata TaxID=151549 RepID=A0A4C1VP59_EUMVA|nr:hypothetical protein EVAR_37593_1 [Eumeta japonica]